MWCDEELEENPEHELTVRFTLDAGDRRHLSLTYCAPETIDAHDGPNEPDAAALDGALDEAVSWWRKWSETLALRSDDEPGARRSGLTLKALTYAPTGAIVAAPTTSLPEALGGTRNWDYRFAWVRDASFSSRAFAELGAVDEADAFRAFIMRSAAGHAGDLQVLYGLGGERRIRGETARRRWRATSAHRRCGRATTRPVSVSSTPTASSSTSPGAGIVAATRPTTMIGAFWCR